MKKTTIIISLVILVITFGCQPTVEKKSDLTTQESIDQLENTLFNTENNTLDKKKAVELSRLYEQWAMENPDSVNAPEYLLKAADVSMNMNNPRRSIGLFDLILKNYPTSQVASSALFLKAFVYDDQLKDYVNAGKFYAEFIEKYPNSPFTNDAEASLKNLGKTPEELVKEFEKKNADN